MNKVSKTHYRNVFKSDHLGSADLEDLIEQGVQLCFTIKEVRQEKGAKVAGKKGGFMSDEDEAESKKRGDRKSVV